MTMKTVAALLIGTLVSVTAATTTASTAANAARTIRAPDIGPSENAPDTVYYERDYFDYVDERLGQLDEPSLWKLSKNPNLESFRFFWAPDEGPAYLMRVDINPEGTGQFTFKTSTGVTEADWGTVAEAQTRPLTEKELKDLRFRFNFMAYWHVKTDDPEDLAIQEGPLWLFEAIHAAKYHAVHRSNPAFGEPRRLGMLLLSFAELGEDDIAWPRRPVPTRPDSK